MPNSAFERNSRALRDQMGITLSEAKRLTQGGVRPTAERAGDQYTVAAGIGDDSTRINLHFPTTSHLLVTGNTGVGKSHFAAQVIDQLNRSGVWDIDIITSHPTDYTRHANHTNTTVSCPTPDYSTPGSGISTVDLASHQRSLESALTHRHDLMIALGVRRWTDVSDYSDDRAPLRPRLVVVDVGAVGAEGRESVGSVHRLAAHIAQIGRGVGVFLMIVSLSPQAIPTTLAELLPTRLVVGSANAIHLAGMFGASDLPELPDALSDRRGHRRWGRIQLPGNRTVLPLQMLPVS